MSPGGGGLLTEYGKWHNEGQINEQKLGRNQSAIAPED